MTLAQIKKEKAKRVNEVIKSCGMFFAFSGKQFEENKTPLAEGDKYVSLANGAYLPASKLPAYRQAVKEINAWFSQAISAPAMREAHIEYELHNHEAFYTGEIDDTLEALGSEYSTEEVIAVYNKVHERSLARA